MTTVKFTRDDFDDRNIYKLQFRQRAENEPPICRAEVYAEVANKKFQSWLESQPKVYSKKIQKGVAPLESHSIYWSEYESDEGYITCKSDGLVARLVAIEEIPKKECEHTIIQYESRKHPVSTGKCGSCGITMVAKWEPA